MHRAGYLAVCVAAAVLLLCPRARAYPWMIKHGYPSCGACHADPSGGELLTAYGREISADVLSTGWHGSSSETGTEQTSGRFSDQMFGVIALPDSILLGGSLRLASIYRPTIEDEKYRFFPMQLDLYGDVRAFGHIRAGGSIGVARVPEGSPHARPAQVTGDQGDGFNLISRSHWLGLELGETGGNIIRAGRLNLPFGIRMSEHVMWVREQTQTDRESDQQHGMAWAMDFETTRFEVMAIAGNYQVRPDAFRERGLSGYWELVFGEKLAVGLSSLYTFAESDRLEPDAGSTSRGAFGATLRAGLGESVALLAEADVLARSRRDPGYVGFVQADFEAVQGLHFLGTGEILDAGFSDAGLSTTSRVPGRGQPKFGGWLSIQWFPFSHFDLRLDAISRQEEPFQLLGQLHVYL